MARPKKNGTYLNVCIETPIYERLENFCKDAGHTKTVAVERALISYFDEYEEMKKKLKELESNFSCSSSLNLKVMHTFSDFSLLIFLNPPVLFFLLSG